MKYDIKHSIIFESRVSEDSFVERPALPDLCLSAVYQGGIGGYPYRAYHHDLFALAAQGVKVSIYPSMEADLEPYHGLTIYDTLPHADLLLALSRFHYAYIGFAFQDVSRETQRYCHACLPNKFFDAMAAGVPVIVRNCKAVERKVRELELGIVWNGEDIRHLAERAHRHYRGNVLEHRHMFTMESQVERLIDLYEAVT